MLVEVKSVAGGVPAVAGGGGGVPLQIGGLVPVTLQSLYVRGSTGQPDTWAAYVGSPSAPGRPGGVPQIAPGDRVYIKAPSPAPPAPGADAPPPSAPQANPQANPLRLTLAPCSSPSCGVWVSVPPEGAPGRLLCPRCTRAL